MGLHRGTFPTTLLFQAAALEKDRSSLQLQNKAFHYNSQGDDYGKGSPPAIASEGQMRNSNLACGLTTGQLIGNKDGDKRMIPFMCAAYGKAAETDWHMGRRGGGGWGGLWSLWRSLDVSICHFQAAPGTKCPSVSDGMLHSFGQPWR